MIMCVCGQGTTGLASSIAHPHDAHTPCMQSHKHTHVRMLTHIIREALAQYTVHNSIAMLYAYALKAY